MRFFIGLWVCFYTIYWIHPVFSQELNAEVYSGVPGAIKELNMAKVIFFESDIQVEWKGKELLLKDFKKNSIKINLTEPRKNEESSSISSGLVENDLGGGSKKKAPLAYKNPKLGNVVVSKIGSDPLKNSGLKIIKDKQERTPEGGEVRTIEYEDESKSISYLSKDLKEESSFDNRGVLVWRNIEGEDQGFKYKKTQWEDGSIIREFSRAEGTLSVVSDIQRETQNFSFLNSEKKLIEEVLCEKGICEKN